jgi:hypothetical protein
MYISVLKIQRILRLENHPSKLTFLYSLRPLQQFFSYPAAFKISGNMAVHFDYA